MNNTALINNHKVSLRQATALPEITAVQADVKIDESLLNFETTAELEPLEEIIGQERAMAAVELGLGVNEEGYNIYVSGMTGTGKMETIKKSFQNKLDESKVPGDWIYVNNFDNPDEPWAINLPAGRGRQLRKDMEKLVERLIENLPKAFREEDFSEEKEELSQKYQEGFQDHIEKLEKMAKESGFELQMSPDGNVSFIPLINGKMPKSGEQLKKLPEDEKKRINEGRKDLAKEANKLMQQQREMVQHLSDEIRDIEKKFSGYLVHPIIDAIKEKYEEPRVLQYLEKVEEDILENISEFRKAGKKDQPQGQMLLGLGGEMEPPNFSKYHVNVIVDHSKSKTAPVVVEESPSYRNLFGSIERTVDPRGRLVTDFSQIKAGSMLRANGGYLVFNIQDALYEPFVYQSLKRALKSGKIQLESINPWMPFSAGSLKPEPIPITTKVVVVGSPMLYYMLRFYDEDFPAIFKVRADFGTEMPRDGNNEEQYSRVIAAILKEDNLRPFTRKGVAEVIKYGSRQVSQKSKLLTRFSEIADILREANYFAGADNAETVDGVHVIKALENRVYRSNRIAEKIQELIEQGVILVAIEGRKIGQVNGLAILDLGDYAFGRPSRITTSVGLGSEGVVNIEREANLSGKTHDKGVLILAGYLRNQYGRQKPLALSASICLEQSYGGIEGDSASAAELFALLSNLAKVPFRQDIAITGSVNQWGEIQAIGGVNEKIEGFFDVCKHIELTGKQGVCIPASNVQNLVLRVDVRKAIEDGQFHIWPLKTVDDGLELLSGIDAGHWQEEGTLHWLIDQRFGELAEGLRRFGLGKENKFITASAEAGFPPGPPRTPDEQP